jgi:hypothetical protein
MTNIKRLFFIVIHRLLDHLAGFFGIAETVQFNLLAAFWQLFVNAEEGFDTLALDGCENASICTPNCIASEHPIASWLNSSCI